MRHAYQRIADADKVLAEESGLYPSVAIRAGLAVGLAIAQAIVEVAAAIDEVARAVQDGR